MTKVVVTVERRPRAEYDKVYGPGTEFWEKIFMARRAMRGPLRRNRRQSRIIRKTIARMALLTRLWMRSERRFHDWSDKGWLKVERGREDGLQGLWRLRQP